MITENTMMKSERAIQQCAILVFCEEG